MNPDAFPSRTIHDILDDREPDTTLLDQFAGQIMAAMYTRGGAWDGMERAAYRHAEKMLQARYEHLETRREALLRR